MPHAKALVSAGIHEQRRRARPEAFGMDAEAVREFLTAWIEWGGMIREDFTQGAAEFGK